MRPVSRLPRAGPALLVAAALALAAWVWLSLAGTVVVRDNSGALAGAWILSGESERPLRRLPGGWYVGLPSGDGAVELRCRDGSVEELGYVTAGLHTWIELNSPACGEAREKL